MLIKKEEFVKEKKFDLIVYVCKKCWLVQTKQIVNKRIFFNNNYPYYSSISKTWLKHSKLYVNKITKELKLNNSSNVIEIASNDGYLLQYFKKKNIPCLGIEPTQNTAAVCQKKGIKVIKKFFSYKLSKEISDKADLVICNNVLAHVPDLIDFIKGLENLINNSGIITIEFPHIKNLISKVQFDTIYHEHYFYFSLISLKKIFSKFNLKIFKVDKLSTHGGSLRVYLCKNENQIKISRIVNKIISEEKKFGLKKIKTYLNFKKKVLELRDKSIQFLKICKLKNKTIHAFGAAAKGVTFLNFLKFTKNDINYVYDSSPFKINKFLPESHISVKSPLMIKKNKPDYILILPWNIQKEVRLQLKFVKLWNCKFFTLVPRLKIF